jgi:hypothetical protein
MSQGDSGGICNTLGNYSMCFYVLTWDVSFASAVAHLEPPRRYVQLQGCCGREQRYLPNLQRTIKAVLGYQKTNGINPRSAIRPQHMIVCVILSRKVHMNMGPILKSF